MFVLEKHGPRQVSYGGGGGGGGGLATMDLGEACELARRVHDQSVRMQRHLDRELAQLAL